MRIPDLAAIGDRYDRLYISPHLDDASLSCGGAIDEATAAGDRVLVVTLCTAIPPADGPFSALAHEFHAEWRLSPEDVVTERLREDTRAMERIGVDWYWAGLLDGLYRVPERYNTRESLFGTPAGDDPLLPAVRRLLEALRRQTPRAVIYGPLGVGSHVDHLITHAAMQPIPGVRYYEELPYAIDDPGALERRLRDLGRALEPHSTPIAAGLPAKLDAIASYASQMDALFRGEEAMRRSVAAYTRTVLPEGGERVWTFV